MADPSTTRDTSIFDVGSHPRTGGPHHPETIEEGLAESGARCDLAGRLLADSRFDRAAWVQTAHAAGWPVARIAEVGRLSRMSAYEICKRSAQATHQPEEIHPIDSPEPDLDDD